VTLIASFITTPATPPFTIFSRQNVERNVVRVMLRANWIPTGGLQNVARPIDTTLETYISAGISAQ